MIQTILVPTDGSSQADKAVTLAGDLAQVHRAKVVLLHVLPDTDEEPIPEGYLALADAEHLQLGDVLVAVGEEILRCAEARLRAQGAEVVETAMPHGRPAKAILEYTRTHPVDLIVMGSRGRSTIDGLTLGSVSRKVCHHAPCSCLTVR